MSLNENMTGKVPFGLKNGKLYEVSQVERGLACNCICPSCKKPLVAKQGDKNIPHFAHAIDNSCQTGKETAIHLAAKQIISQNKSVFLPSIYIDEGVKNYGIMAFDEMILEKSISKYSNQFLLIPDITAILQIKGVPKELYIEIAVTHFCEKKKIDAFKKNKLSSIEIDLSSLLNEKNVNFEVIENIINQGKNTTWLYNQRLELEEEKRRKKEEERRKTEEERKKREEVKLRKINSLMNLFYQEKVRNRKTFKWNNLLLENAKKILGVNNLNDLPVFISDPSDIDALYPIDGRLVRLYIYENFILRRKSISKLKERAFSVESVIQYLKSEKKLYPNKFIYELNKLMYDDDQMLLMSFGDNVPNFNIKIIISDYLFELRRAGFLKYNGDYFFKLSYKIAPNKLLCKQCFRRLSSVAAPLKPVEYCKYCGAVQ